VLALLPPGLAAHFYIDVNYIVNVAAAIHYIANAFDATGRHSEPAIWLYTTQSSTSIWRRQRWSSFAPARRLQSSATSASTPPTSFRRRLGSFAPSSSSSSFGSVANRIVRERVFRTRAPGSNRPPYRRRRAGQYRPAHTTFAAFRVVSAVVGVLPTPPLSTDRRPEDADLSASALRPFWPKLS